MKTLSDEELVAQLAKSGREFSSLLMEEILSRGDRMVKPLSAVLLDGTFSKESFPDIATGDCPEQWAPMHAFVLLGLLGSSGAASAITTWLCSGPVWDDVFDVGEAVLGHLGSGAVEPILDYLRDFECDPALRGIAAKGLVQIGYRDETVRPAIANEAARLLRKVTAKNDSEMTTMLVDAFFTVDDGNVMEVIDDAFDKGVIDPRCWNRKDLELERHEHEPWWTFGLEEDLRGYFRSDSTDKLSEAPTKTGGPAEKEHQDTHREPEVKAEPAARKMPARGENLFPVPETRNNRPDERKKPKKRRSLLRTLLGK